MKRIAMLLLVATGLATVASAASWIKLGQSKDHKTTMSLDLDSIQRKGDFAWVWVKFVIGEKGEYSLQHHQIRRDTHQFRVLSYVHYGVTDNLLDTQNYNESEPWDDVPPDSLEEWLYKALSEALLGW